MDIVFVSQSYLPKLGGVPRQAGSLASYLRSRGHRVTVITSTPGPPSKDVLRLDGQSPAAFFYHALRAIRKRRPQVVHGHDPLAAAIAAASSRSSKAHSVASVHDLWPLCPRGTYSNTLRGYEECSTKSLLAECPSCAGWNRQKVLFYEAYHLSTYKGLDAVIAVSDYVKNQLTERFGPHNIGVIHNWVNTTEFHHDPDGRERFRRTYEIQDGRKVVLFLSRLIPEKGAQFLIAAAKTLLRTSPETAIIIASDGWFRGALEDLARKEGVAGRVRFIGRVPDDLLVPCYSAADVLAYPAIAGETFSLVPLEAAACETAICASDSGGTPEVILDGDTGFLHRAGDAEELTDTLTAALDDDDLRWRVGKRARAFVSDRHSVDGLGPEYEKIYRSL